MSVADVVKAEALQSEGLRLGLEALGRQIRFAYLDWLIGTRGEQESFIFLDWPNAKH